MTFISTKSCSDLVAEAESVISYISVDDAQKFLETGNAEFIDKNYRELEKTGVIPGAHSCPRGLLNSGLIRKAPTQERLTLTRCSSSTVITVGVRH